MSEDATDPPGLGTLPVARLLEELGSARPIPGGGSVAGITNGLAAGLGGMVVAYSLGKPRLAEHQSMLEEADRTLAGLRERSIEEADGDARAYRSLNALWTLDRDDPERIEGFQSAVEGAIAAPGAIMETSAELLDCLGGLAGRSARHLASDLAIAVELAATAGRAAERNVAVNLPLLEDDARRAELDGRYGGLGQRIDECARGIIGNMDG